MKFCIRVDDIGWTPTESSTPPIKEPDAGLELAQKFHEAMNGLPYLAGVIPGFMDEIGLNWLRSRPTGLTVALHGWNHALSGGDRDEFAYHNVGQIRHKLALGQALIGPTEHYIPPFNAVSDKLPAAAWNEGIRYIWGAQKAWPTPPSPYYLYKCLFIPAWAPLYGASGWAQNCDSQPLLTTVSNVLDTTGYAVISLHITWEAGKESGTFWSLRKLVNLIQDSVISPQDFVKVCQ